jgi:alkane 1-monooxygenase
MAYYVGGWAAVGFFMACGLIGKALLEIVNYIEHYGIVRDPNLPVQPRHSWNTNSRISSWSMFNLTRHSHHHAQGEVPYHDLKSVPDAPLMFSGYLTTILVTLIPPLWQAVMIPKLKAWDRDYASPAERVLAKEANVRSGVRALQTTAA